MKIFSCYECGALFDVDTVKTKIEKLRTYEEDGYDWIEEYHICPVCKHKNLIEDGSFNLIEL